MRRLWKKEFVSFLKNETYTSHRTRSSHFSTLMPETWKLTFTQNVTRMVTEALFLTAPVYKQQRRLPVGAAILWDATQQQKGTSCPYTQTWIALEGVMQSEISQTQKVTYCLIPFTCHSQTHIEMESRSAEVRR